jgi:hypothetical protein
MDGDLQVRPSQNHFMHTITPCATDIEHTSTPVCQLIYHRGQVLEDCVAMRAKIHLVFVSRFKVFVNYVWIDVGIHPYQPTLATLQ